jgi:hypothetical protein
VKIKIYKTIILPVVLNGCETWSLTLREEHGLRVFENRVLRGIWTLRKGIHASYTFQKKTNSRTTFLNLDTFSAFVW